MADVEWEKDAAYEKVRKMLEEGDEWNIVFRTFYAGYVEFGTGPSHEPNPKGQFTPPIAPIFAWVERKLGYQDDKARSVAYAIRQKIAESGARAHPFARPAVFEAEAHIAELLEKELSLEPVMEYIAMVSKENIRKNGTSDTTLMASEVYLVHGAVKL